MNEPIIRMYVDENGHQSLKGDLSQNDKRFLCMTGIIMPLREHDSTLTPMMQALKERFLAVQVLSCIVVNWYRQSHHLKRYKMKAPGNNSIMTFFKSLQKFSIVLYR